MYRIQTSGVCSSEIYFDIEEGKIKHVEFVGGCPGNAIGLSRMVIGVPIAQVVEKLKDVKCGHKNTSCPAQLALALQSHL